MTVMLSGAARGRVKKLKDNIFIAAHQLEAALDDLELRDGVVSVRANGASMSLADVGMAAYWQKAKPARRDGSGLEASFTYDPPFFNPAQLRPHRPRGVLPDRSGHGCHVVVVEVDPETGQVEFLKYVAVHDLRHDREPCSLEGQVRGGIAQGYRGGPLRAGPPTTRRACNLAPSYDEYVVPRRPRRARGSRWRSSRRPRRGPRTG